MSTPDRMLSILDLFRDDTIAVFQEDVMEHLECSRATAYRYLKSLTESGLPASTAGGAYVLGSRIIELDRPSAPARPAASRCARGDAHHRR